MEMFSDQDFPKQARYISLATKYRPQTFEEVVGQDSVSKTLTNALKSGRIAHAYLFYGPRGCGKTTMARLLAKSLNCAGYPEDKPTPKPCGKCPQCIEIAASADMDVLELDAASNTQVEKVREAIIDTVALASGRDRYKVFILDEVHMLSASSFNALLKTIEEPPGHVVFILATTELNKVPLTISSRCQTFRFKPITEGETVLHLMDLAGAENINLDEEAAKIIAKSADGAMRDALTIFDRAISFSGGKIGKDVINEMLGLMPLDLVQAAVEAVAKNDGLALHEVFETVRSEGLDPLSLLKDVKNALGEIFYFSLGADKEPFKDAKNILAQSSPGFIAGLTRKISRLVDEIKFSDTPLLLAEVGLFTIMENTLDIESFISRLEALENGADRFSEEKKSLNNPGPVEKEPKAAYSEKKKLLEKEIFLKSEPGPAFVEPAVETAAPAVFSTSEEMWKAFKKGLSDYPFLYDIMQEVSPSFPQDDKWVLKFRSKDADFKGTVQNRLKDIQATALKVCGTKINFELVLEEGFVSAPAARTSAPAPKTAPLKAARVLSPQSREETLIIKEESFLAGDYSVFSEENSSPKEAGETAQKILNIFEGYVVEAI
jgi:DNA polymerase-3 subunit gamma/tau